MGTDDWTSLALLVVCYAGLGFIIFRSSRQLSASVTVVTSKRFDAVAAGWSTLAKFKPSGYGILFFPVLHRLISRLEAHSAQCPLYALLLTNRRMALDGEIARCGSVRPEGAEHQWRKVPPRELSVDLVADERGGQVTGRFEAS